MREDLTEGGCDSMSEGEREDRSEDARKSVREWAFFGILSLLVVAAWFATPKIAQKLSGNTKAGDVGVFGDQYGSINALFSGLAFVALIMTLRLQMTELRLNREELQMQRQELESQRKEMANQAHALDVQSELMRLSAQLQALPTLLVSTKERIMTEAPGYAPLSFKEMTFGVEQLDRRIAYTRERIKALPGEIAEKEAALASLSGMSHRTTRENSDLNGLHTEVRRLKEELPREATALPLMIELRALTASLTATYEQIQLMKTASNKEKTKSLPC